MRWNASDGNGHSPTSLHEVIRTSKSVAKCCRADTQLASSSNVSRSRPTTGPHGCFVTARLMILRKRSAPRWPRRVSQHPPRAWARGYFDGSHRSRAEGETGPSKQDPNPPQGATRRGPRRADVITAHSRTQADNARPIRHSVGRKVAIHWNIAGASQFGH